MAAFHGIPKKASGVSMSSQVARRIVLVVFTVALLLPGSAIAQKYHRPTLVMSIDGEQAVGSARSIPTIDLHSQLESISDVFSPCSCLMRSMPRWTMAFRVA